MPTTRRGSFLPELIIVVGLLFAALESNIIILTVRNNNLADLKELADDKVNVADR